MGNNKFNRKMIVLIILCSVFTQLTYAFFAVNKPFTPSFRKETFTKNLVSSLKPVPYSKAVKFPSRVSSKIFASAYLPDGRDEKDKAATYLEDRDWQLNQYNQDSRQKLAKFFQTNEQFFKNRQIKMKKAFDDENGDKEAKGFIDEDEIVDPEKLTPYLNDMLTNADLVEEAYTLMGISKQLEDISNLEKQHRDLDISGWGSVVVVIEEEDDNGSTLEKGNTTIIREMDEIDEELQSRYLQFLEEQFEGGDLQINDTMNEDEIKDVEIMREYNILLNQRVELLVHSLKAKANFKKYRQSIKDYIGANITQETNNDIIIADNTQFATRYFERLQELHRTIFNNELKGHINIKSYVNSLNLNQTIKAKIFELHNIAIDDMDDEDRYDMESADDTEVDSGDIAQLLKNKETQVIRMDIDLQKLEDELKEMEGGEDGEEWEIIFAFNEFEGMYGSQLIQYLISLEQEEVLERGEAYKILSLSIEWPVDMMIDVQPGNEFKPKFFGE